MEENEILKKLSSKQKLTKKEFEFFVMGYLKNSICKEDMTKFLSLIFKNGLSSKETFDLTDVMMHSGEILSFSKGIYCDKHSTGGISDSTTLIIMPIIALSGLKFLKMSGRKLGFTGGTIDKVEKFDGFKTDMSINQAEKLVSQNGACLLAQTKDLAPADKVIYKLRDETGLVNSLPLIASSIMSKKLASGAHVIVLDVKCGSGAFMKNFADAKKLAEIMVEIGKMAGKKICAVVSDMNESLGQNVGSELEAIEAIEVLEGKTGKLKDLSVILASKIIELGKNISFEKAKSEVLQYLTSGLAFEKLKELIAAQGGSLDLFNKTFREQRYTNKIDIVSNQNGYLCAVDAEKLGQLNREYCNEGNFGIKIHKKIGDKVEKGEKLITLYGKESKFDWLSLFKISQNKVNNPLIYEIIV